MKKQNIKVIVYIASAFLLGAILSRAMISSSTPEDEISHQHEEGSEYTCSMHPQIRQETPGSCPICGMALIPVGGQNQGTSSNGPLNISLTAEAAALANISTLEVGTETGAVSKSLTGKIEADERAVRTATANFEGRVEELFVAFTGQTVSKGQRLATLYVPALISAKKELEEAKKMQSSNPEIYQAARQKLKNWQLSEKQIDRLEQEGYQATFEVYANSNGVVTEKKVAPGDYVSKGQVLYEITDLTKVWAVLDVFENDAQAFQEGDKIEFTIPSLPQETFEATVSFVGPVLTGNSRSIRVRAELPNKDKLLKPGMFVNATIARKQREKVEQYLSVPSSAILWTGKRSVVYLAVGTAEDPVFELREVVLGSTSGDQQEVLKGLKAGDRIVSNGLFAVDAAAQLAGKYSMMKPPSSELVALPQEQKLAFDGLLEDYFTIKNKLATDQSASSEAKVMGAHLAAFAKDGLNEKAKKIWVEQAAAILQAVETISASSELAKQRDHFYDLSTSMIELLKTYGTSKEVYQDYCPMADEDEGAFWLSEFKEIKNPYFGESMLRCGEIKKSWLID